MKVALSGSIVCSVLNNLIMNPENDWEFTWIKQIFNLPLQTLCMEDVQIPHSLTCCPFSTHYAEQIWRSTVTNTDLDDCRIVYIHYGKLEIIFSSSFLSNTTPTKNIQKAEKKINIECPRCQKVHIRKNTSYLQNTSRTSHLVQTQTKNNA